MTRVRVRDSVRVSVGCSVVPNLVGGRGSAVGGGVPVEHNPGVVPPSRGPHPVARAGAIRPWEAGGAQGCGVTSHHRVQGKLSASRDSPWDTVLCAATEPRARFPSLDERGSGMWQVAGWRRKPGCVVHRETLWGDKYQAIREKKKKINRG